MSNANSRKIRSRIKALRNEMRICFRDVVVTTVGFSFIPMSARWRIYRLLGFEFKKSGIASGAFFGSKNVSVGAATFVNYRCFFDGPAQIHLGERCNIGYEVMFATSTHSWGDQTRRAGSAESHPIHVGDGVWIGARAVVLGGVKISDGVIIAAGSVVVSDCEKNSLYGGVPARKIRELT